MISENTDRLLENLAELSRRDSLSREQSDICISLFATLAEKSDISLEDIYSRFNDILADSTAAKKAALCARICETKNIKDFSDLHSFSDTLLPVPAGSHGKICLMRNRYNDAALSLFAGTIPHSKAVYFSNFEECCEAVADGKCEFTILPVENTADGRMFGFYSLIDRYELKISAVCKIDTDDLSKSVSYALVGRNLLSSLLTKQKDRPRYVEFCLSCDGDTECFEIFEAARTLGLRLDGISSIPLAYDDSRMRVYFSLSSSSVSALCAMLTYLSLEFPRYTPIGAYWEINNE